MVLAVGGEMEMKGSRLSIWRIIVVVIIGSIIGSYVADYFSMWYKPLGYYKSIGMAAPTEIDLSVFKILFQLSIKANIGTIAGLIAALYVNNRI